MTRTYEGLASGYVLRPDAGGKQLRMRGPGSPGGQAKPRLRRLLPSQMSPFDREALCAPTQRADPSKASYFVPCMVPCMAAIACSAGLKAALARLEWSSPILVACATKSAYAVLAYSDWI
jgi:hypothetical protein